MSSQRVAALSAAALVAFAVTSGAQQRGRAQQPPPPPNPLGQPLLDPAGRPKDDAFIRIPLRPEDQKYADIDGRRMKEFVREVAAISQKDREAGGPKSFWG